MKTVYIDRTGRHWSAGTSLSVQGQQPVAGQGNANLTRRRHWSHGGSLGGARSADWSLGCGLAGFESVGVAEGGEVGLLSPSIVAIIVVSVAFSVYRCEQQKVKDSRHPINRVLHMSLVACSPLWTCGGCYGRPSKTCCFL